MFFQHKLSGLERTWSVPADYQKTIRDAVCDSLNHVENFDNLLHIILPLEKICLAFNWTFFDKAELLEKRETPDFFMLYRDLKQNNKFIYTLRTCALNFKLCDFKKLFAQKLNVELAKVHLNNEKENAQT
jgi:hypothetical protein